MKSTPTAREVALQTLLRIERDHAYSNLALQTELSANRHLSQVDKALVTELVYGTMQRLNTLDYAIAQFLKQSIEKVDADVRNVLRLGAYQILFLDRIPAFAAIHESVEIIKRRKQRAAGFVNGVLRNLQRAGRQVLRISTDDPVRALALETSHPEWLVRLWIDQYGVETTARICQANLERSHVHLRVNTLRISRDACIERLQREGINVRPSEVLPDAIEVLEGTDIRVLETFQQGLITVQDESSMLVAYCLQPEPGESILDACAAPGGKTTHIAQLMQDTGSIQACDIHPHKIGLIRDTASRLGLTSIQPLLCDARKLPASTDPFDRILLDAPCSGLGVLRHKPDIKWTKIPDTFPGLIEIQQELLDHLAPLVKAGGVLVYSTCTLHAQENQSQIQRFLERHPDFALESLRDIVPACVKPLVTDPGWLEIKPYDLGSDGFFIARLRKKGS
jgi:16S rRNA (cytosine967-C5)-methyltransferase